MNADWIYHLPAPLRKTAYFALQQAIGSRVFSAWRDFLSWEKLTRFQLQTRVSHRLDDLLHHALNHSPLYRSLSLQSRAGQSAPEFLRRFPILKRADVRERFTDIVIDPLRSTITSPEVSSPRRYSWLIVKTGGTTGSPTSVVHDARFRDSGRATRLYAQRLCGFPLGTRYFRLWGSEQDLLQQKEKLDRRILRNLLGERPMNAFRAKEEELACHYTAMRQHPEVRHLMAYVDAAAGLAEYIRDRQLDPPKLDSLMACAGTVTPEWRQLLESTFQTRVFDKYGSRDCADLACESSAHNGLHVFSPHVYLEIVDDQDKPCPPGETGRLLATLLMSHSFPLIRYEVGDLAVWAKDEPCPSGLPFPRLASLQGRQDDMLLTQDGTKLSSVFIRHFVGVSLNRQLIREWQLEQVGPRQFKFRFIASPDPQLDKNLAQLKDSFLKAFGDQADIQMLPVNEIPPSATGKVRWIINSIQ